MQDVEHEAKKNTLSERWGEVEFIGGRIFGDYILGFLGVIANTVILAAIFDASTGWTVASWIFSAIICISAEWTVGKGAFQIARAVKEGKHEEGGQLRAMLAMGFYVLFFLTASLYLSSKSGTVVEVAGERNIQAQAQDDRSVESYYVARIAELRKAEAEKIADAKARAAELNQHRNAKGEVYWNSRKAASDILGKEVPAIQAATATQIAALEKERQQMVGRVLSSNDATKATITERVQMSSTMLVWINIAINLIRVFLLSMYSIFISDTIEERKKVSKSSHAPPPAFSMPAMPARPAMATMSTPTPVEQVVPPPVSVQPFHRKEKNTVEWDLSRTFELSPNISGTAGTGTPGTAPRTAPSSVPEIAGERVPAGNDTRNTNTHTPIRNTQGTAERLTYVNARGERKEYTRAEVQSLCRKYAKRAKEHAAKGNTAAYENNMQMLQNFKNLLA